MPDNWYTTVYPISTIDSLQFDRTSPREGQTHIPACSGLFSSAGKEPEVFQVRGVDREPRGSRSGRQVARVEKFRMVGDVGVNDPRHQMREVRSQNIIDAHMGDIQIQTHVRRQERALINGGKHVIECRLAIEDVRNTGLILEGDIEVVIDRL